LQQYGLTLTPELFDTYIRGNNDAYVASTLLGGNRGIDLAALSALKDRLFCEHINQVQIVPGVHSFLSRAQQHGHQCAVVTNCNLAVANAIIRHLALDQYISLIVASDTPGLKRGKPYPDPYQLAMTQFGALSSQVVVIEDSKSGLLSARAIEPRRLIGISTTYDKAKLLALGVDQVIADFTSPDLPLTMTDLQATGRSLETLQILRLEQALRRSFLTAKHFSLPSATDKLKGGFISDVLAVRIDGRAVILKVQSASTTMLSTMAEQLQLHQREYYFYEAIARYVPIRVPAYLGLLRDADYRPLGLVLENLYQIGNYILNLNLNTASLDVSLQIITQMACLHANFWQKPLQSAWPELRSATSPCFRPFCSQFLLAKWPKFTKTWAKLLTPAQLSLGQRIVDGFSEIQSYMASAPQTLIHGDIKSPNIFYDQDQQQAPVFLDWQHVAQGKGVQDLIFFLLESFELSVLTARYQLFRDYYYAKLQDYGVQSYTRDNFEHDLHYALCYIPFFTAVWFGTVSHDELIDKNFPYFLIQKLFHLLSVVNPKLPEQSTARLSGVPLVSIA
jgi:HAD superfamily hydrolase (TIGR01509 family)